MYNNNSPKFITKTEMLNSGWTERGIKRFLGSPDREELNPQYPRSAAMKLYLYDRVLSAEKSEEFKIWLQQSTKRSNAVQKGKSAKRMKRLEKFRDVEIAIPQMDFKGLANSALDEFNKQCWTNRAPLTPSFLARAIVRYLWNHVTPSDVAEQLAPNKRVAPELRKLIRSRVYTEIINSYPKLRKECSRQLDDGINPFLCN